MNAVVIDLVKLRDFESGLGQFCFHLHRNFQNKADYAFLTHRAARRYFGPGDKLAIARPWNKIGLGLPDASVWHSTHQDSPYFPFRTSARKVLTIHDLSYVHQRADRPRKVQPYLRRLQRKIDASDVVVFVSEFTRDDAGKHLKTGHRETQVIYNGIALTDEGPVPFPLPTERKFLLSIGKFHPRKNLLPLVKMMTFLEDFALVIAGDDTGACADEVRSLIRQLNLGDRVFTVGRVDESGKRWLYEKCELLAMPSSHEGFGLPVVEAHSLGVPTIVSRLAALPEIAGPDSFYFSSLSPEEMAANVKEALDLLALKPTGDRLRKNAARFSWKRAAAGYEEIYRRLREPRG